MAFHPATHWMPDVMSPVSFTKLLYRALITRCFLAALVKCSKGVLVLDLASASSRASSFGKNVSLNSRRDLKVVFPACIESTKSAWKFKLSPHRFNNEEENNNHA